MKAVKSLKYIAITAVAVAAVAVVALVADFAHKASDIEVASVEVAHTENINITPQVVSRVRDIGQWEFLSITDEEMVETTEHRTLSPDAKLVVIYSGTLRIGIDLKKARPDWVVNHSDSLVVTLPHAGLLDSRFIDEANARVFYQRGEISASARSKMAAQAAAKMRVRTLTPSAIAKAEKMASRRFEELFLSLGAKAVTVKFE